MGRVNTRQPVPAWTDLPPAAGAVVMATGILSVGLELTAQHSLSLAAMVVAALLWLLLAAEFGWRLLRDTTRFGAEADTPPALTAVAATAVLGTRLSMFGWQTVAAVLLVLAAAVWPVLLGAVMLHWSRRMPGAAFLVCVATQSLAVLAGTLAVPDHQRWLARTGLVFFLLGLLLYLEALTRFDPGQLRTGHGDHWIAGGALSISALAGARLTASAVWTGSGHAALRTITLVLLGLALAGYVVLVVCEVLWPRPRYDIRRWSTVFPLGMTAAACLATADAARVHWLRTLGQVLLWIGVAAWVLTLAWLVAAMTRLGSGGEPNRRPVH